MAGTYRNYMRLLESWPLDKLKPGRDLSQHIRDQVKLAFTKGETSQLDKEVCDRYYMSLKRITSNYYGQMYTRTHTSSASGLSKEQCNLALSPEMLEYFNDLDKGILVRTYARLMRYYKEDKKDASNVSA
ncbi:ubiquinol-cytochrome-c reductase complex assembly factor 2 [Colletes gigas]|uniref:ubiquinol-cytochrome-c reductase complex assembly factor 2 n=1 Tax=Colletes gigas TaxID=935657 RepID=UPI001C9B37A7|nr:ubiquinol-cytochrome-c reductase complex assembly factor 2 [Colletes gigas]XP_043258128.1 ubiquinol-cytochrome-c reductase complex assembly factor 2 [Colletes gigas]